MRAIHSPGFESFFHRVRASPSSVLLLDYDGTLAPIREDPRGSPPVDWTILSLVGSIADLPTTRVAIVSGRPARQLEEILGRGRRIEIWGSHGLERLRADGSYEAERPSRSARSHLLSEAAALERRGFERSLERKPFGLVLHDRGAAPALASELRREALGRWQKLRTAGLVVQPSEYGIELRVSGRDKGFVVQTVLNECGPDAACAYLGDDYSDEEAFRAIRGRGMGVLVRPSPRETAADAWLRSPDDVREFLRRWRECAFAGTGGLQWD